MRYLALEDWLAFQQRLHPAAIDMGLDRVAAVLARLALPQPLPPVITIGGTNGKGSTVAFLEAMLAASGRRVGAFTSPHLLDYNERVRVDGQPVGDEALVEAFARLDDARGDISLTFFEWNALAALLVFAGSGCDVWLLEVGLGGRLDAVNALDADVAVVVSIGLDHCDYLGPTLEHIGAEKAGIFRKDRPAIFGALDMPATVGEAAAATGADLWRLGRDFDAEPGHRGEWTYRGRGWTLQALPAPALAGAVQYRNAAAAIAALESLRARLPVGETAVRAGLLQARVAGRFQVIDGAPEWILDVGHNPAAAAELAANLDARPCAGRTWLVAGILRDKDIEGIAARLDGRGEWIAVGLEGDRALAVNELARRLAAQSGASVRTAPSVEAGCELARQLAGRADRIVVFGSFHTVGPALRWHRGG